MKKYNLFILFTASIILTSCGNGPTNSTLTQSGSKTQVPKAINIVAIIQSGDTDRCSELKEQDKIANCKNGIYLEQATKNNNPAECDNITNTGAVERCKQQTYFNLAITSANPELCGKIPGKKENIINCKNQIILNQAYASKDEKVCESIEGDTEKISCKDNIKLQVAMNTSDNKLCKEIKTKTIQMQCEQFVSPKPIGVESKIPPPKNPIAK